MRLFKKILAFFFLSFGIPFSLYAVSEIANPSTPTEDREGAVAALLIFSLPCTVIGSCLVWSLVQEQKQKRIALEAQSSEQLRDIFFHLLEENHGQVTVLQMSKAANLHGEEAKNYLDQRAVEFDANFETNESGAVIYKFPQ